jgi:hypothetical protein
MFATAVSGCAFGTRHVNLTYAPSLGPTPVRPPTYERVAVARFEDARSPKQGTGSLLGKVRNGYGMPTASVLANQDPVLWVNEGVARALIAQGLQREAPLQHGSRGVEARFRNLDSLRRQGVIGQAEYRERRQDILTGAFE